MNAPLKSKYLMMLEWYKKFSCHESVLSVCQMQIQIEFDAAPPVHLVFQEMGLNKNGDGRLKAPKTRSHYEAFIAIARSRHDFTIRKMQTSGPSVANQCTLQGLESSSPSRNESMQKCETLQHQCLHHDSINWCSWPTEFLSHTIITINYNSTQKCAQTAD